LKDWWPLETYGAAWLAKNKHFLIFPISQNKILNIVAFTSAREDELKDVKESWTLAGDKASVQEEFKHFDGTVQRIIEYMDTNPQKWLLFDRLPFKKWVFSEGKVLLLGDAAHAMLPHQGRPRCSH
jgi:salicylate hydroxylase